LLIKRYFKWNFISKIFLLAAYYYYYYHYYFHNHDISVNAVYGHRLKDRFFIPGCERNMKNVASILFSFIIFPLLIFLLYLRIFFLFI